MRNQKIKKLGDALVAIGGLMIFAYLVFLGVECVSWLWNQNDFLLACSGF